MNDCKQAIHDQYGNKYCWYFQETITYCKPQNCPKKKEENAKEKK